MNFGLTTGARCRGARRLVVGARRSPGFIEVLAGRSRSRRGAERRGAAILLLQAMSLADVSGPIRWRASDPFPAPLGTLDAIHLATALAWREARHPALIMPTNDGQLALAAQACGFEVVGAG